MGVRLKRMRGSGLRCDTGHSFIHSRFSFWSNEASREPKVLLEEFVSSSGSIHLKRVRAITPETHSSTAPPTSVTPRSLGHFPRLPYHFLSVLSRSLKLFLRALNCCLFWGNSLRVYRQSIKLEGSELYCLLTQKKNNV